MAKHAKSGKQGAIRRPVYRRPLFILFFLLVASFCIYLGYLNYLVSLRFDGSTWTIPSRVYARPLELYRGLNLSLADLRYELDLATYELVRGTPLSGQYRINAQSIELHTRSFSFIDGGQPSIKATLSFKNNRLERISDANAHTIELLRLPPIVLGSYYPESDEDRLLLTGQDIPVLLKQILIAVEDKQFYRHIGINPFSIMRALIANYKAGRAVQGGSTITQQLAKNLFLTPEKSLLRKINEAFMALLLEIRLTKDQIINAYINEVFLIQQNSIAVHGYGLASRMLFRQTINHLSMDKLALLVGMVKGPSQYNPINHAGAALERRNLVLRIARDHKIIDSAELQKLRNKPLGVVSKLPEINPFPAYLDLVKRQLRTNYSAQALAVKGLQVFTPFDPLIQEKLEQGLKSGLKRFKRSDLQSAVVMADYLNGDIVALVGGREVKFPGFNRAIMAQRPIGSLVKPLLLYGLLEGAYSLASLVDDKPVRIQQSDNKVWEPQNYDRQLHGEMTLYQAFIKSYNLPFVRLGVNGGLQALVENLQKIKLMKHRVVYPSILLGTTAMSAFEVAQLYQVIANNGYFTPLTTIRGVSDHRDQLLSTVPIDSHKLFNQASMIQVQRALIGVGEEGTAKYLAQRFPGQTLAGKTGTTDDSRDSWFAGFSDRLLAVVWLGRDDNAPINLSGSSGALRIWADIMQRQRFDAFKLTREAQLEWHYVNRFDGGLTLQSCQNSVLLPFVRKSVPTHKSRCE